MKHRTHRSIARVPWAAERSEATTPRNHVVGLRPIHGTHNCSIPRSAFTLVEVIIVIAILALLVMILAPSINRAREIVKKNLTRARFAMIEQACEDYYTALGEYPDAGDDEELLVEYLVGPGDKTKDGKDGPGFKDGRESRIGGKVYGPFGNVQEFVGKDGGKYCFVDVWGNPIETDVDPARTRKVHLQSYGTDGKKDTSDDIKNDVNE